MTAPAGSEVPRGAPVSVAEVRPVEVVDRVRVTRAMTPGQRWAYACIVALWAAVNLYHWIWWLRAEAVGNVALYVLTSAAMLYVFTVLPTIYLFFLGQMRKPVHIDVRHAKEQGRIGRVAVIALTVPGSESLDIVERQMVAMKGIRYPHDSWILVDKVHSPEIERLAAEHGLLYFSRHDVQTWGAVQVARWNRSQPPFAAKTKAGNVNSWLDAFLGTYTHFTQFDIDHVPNPDYLDRVLGYFADPAVAYVQAPSVYSNHWVWTARGSSEQELVLQGPLQMGFFGFARTPFIIGSHCTYDMQAVRGIGGFQPTRAEDHLDTVVLAAKGFEGVFVPEIIARGEGPEDFKTYLAQQFAWAYSMIQVLFSYTPRLVRRYTPRRAFQFLFVQTWYTFWSLSMLILFAAPLLALVADEPVARVTYWAFLLHILPVAIASSLTWLWSRRWHLPRGVRLSWRGILLHVARWVVVLSALVQVILRVKKPYMITAKGLRGSAPPPFPLAAVMPYLALIGLSLAACWFYLLVHGGGPRQGYLLFALKGALIFWLMFLVLFGHDLFVNLRQRTPILTLVRARLGATTVLVLVSVSFVVTASASAAYILAALTG
ncbi:glycosyltransferase family 2 protein [Pseudonocardia saturnea]